MIQVMKRHLANKDIIVHTCKALLNIAVNTKNQVTIAKAVSIPVRINALEHHRKERAYPDLVTLVFQPFSIFLALPMMSLGIS